MTVRPIHASFLAAYFNAGIAVAGAQFGLPVYRVSIVVKNYRRERPTLMKFSDFLKVNAARGAEATDCDDYVTMLLAGSVGRVLGLEKFLGYPSDCLERSRLERALRFDALQCHDYETDLAYSLAFGWLAHRDDGNVQATLGRLWRRANTLLRKAQQRDALERLATELLKRKAMDIEAIQALMW